MNPEFDTKPPAIDPVSPATSHLRDAAREFAHQATIAAEDMAKDVTIATKDAAIRAPGTAKEVYHSAAHKAGDTLMASKECVRRNPVSTIVGAVVFGAAVGYLVMMASRKQTFGERYVEEPAHAVREAILGALAPMTHRVHRGYDAARHGAGRSVHSLSDQLGRVGSNLKFW